MKAVNLAEKLAGFGEYWQGQFNGHDVMVVKVKGESVWHRHDGTDDLFLLLKGADGGSDVMLGAGEMFVVPKGVEHEHGPVAEEEHVLLSEPVGTPNTGGTTTAAKRRVI